MRTVASGVLGAATAAAAIFSAWLDPAAFAGLGRGDLTNWRLLLLALVPLLFAAALWLFRKAPAAVWWLAWSLASAMVALSLVLAVGFHAMGQAIEADGLIP